MRRQTPQPQRSGPAQQQSGPDHAGRRCPDRRQGGVLPAQWQRVHGDPHRLPEGPPDPRQRQLPLHRRRTLVHLRQFRRRRGGVCPRIPRPDRAAAAPPVEGQALAGNRRRGTGGIRPVIRAGRRDRRRRTAGYRALARRPAIPLHRRHHRQPQGRDVAPWLPVPPPHPQPATRPGQRPRTIRRNAAHQRAWGQAIASLPHDARHRAVHRHRHAAHRRMCGQPAVAAL